MVLDQSTNIMKVFYDSAIFLYTWGIRLAALFSSRAQRWTHGRKGIFRKVENSGITGEKVVWFHAASLGEFEQGRPVIEAFRKKHPEYKILLTFFSPSGYEVRKDYKGADYIFYLPADTKRNALRFIRVVRPVMAVFIKYEFWLNYIASLHREGIPLIHISSVFRPDQYFFRGWGGFALKRLRKIERIFVQDRSSLQLLHSRGIMNAGISGDTRFDRVHEERMKNTPVPAIERWIDERPVVVAGSTWPEDESLLIEWIQKYKGRFRFIIAPHEVGEERIQSLIKKTGGSSVERFSELRDGQAGTGDILIIDGIGILSRLYKYGFVAFIGGGFGKGIHNILEAVAFGKPVIFGPVHEKFREAVELTRLGGAFPVRDFSQMESVINRLSADPDYHERCSAICRNFIEENTGATEKIMEAVDGIIGSISSRTTVTKE